MPRGLTQPAPPPAATRTLPPACFRCLPGLDEQRSTLARGRTIVYGATPAPTAAIPCHLRRCHLVGPRTTPLLPHCRHALHHHPTDHTYRQPHPTATLPPFRVSTTRCSLWTCWTCSVAGCCSIATLRTYLFTLPALPLPPSPVVMPTGEWTPILPQRPTPGARTTVTHHVVGFLPAAVALPRSRCRRYRLRCSRNATRLTLPNSGLTARVVPLHLRASCPHLPPDAPTALHCRCRAGTNTRPF